MITTCRCQIREIRCNRVCARKTTTLRACMRLVVARSRTMQLKTTFQYLCTICAMTITAWADQRAGTLSTGVYWTYENRNYRWQFAAEGAVVSRSPRPRRSSTWFIALLVCIHITLSFRRGDGYYCFPIINNNSSASLSLNINFYFSLMGISFCV